MPGSNLKTSWLAKVKNIYELGSWNSCSRDWVREDFSIERDERRHRKFAEHIKRGMPVAEEFQPWFHNSLHDDWIIWHERDDDYRLYVACRWADDLHSTLLENCGHKAISTYFLSEIVCHQASYVRWSKSDQDGGLTFWRPNWEKNNFKSINKPGDLESRCDLISDWFFTEESRIQWIVRAYPIGSPSFAGYVYGMIDCESISVIDHRERQLVSVWGEQVLPIWRAIVALPYHERGGFISSLSSQALGIEPIQNQTNPHL